jgi:nickel/cobalt exporter
MALPDLSTIAATGFTVAFMHAAIPTHWLPFVLVGRARGWTHAKTLGVVALAGAGHVVLTSLLGVGIAWFGFKLDERVGAAFPWVAAGVLGAMGVFYLWRQWRGGGICHHPVPGGHHHADEHCGHEEDNSHWEEELKDSALVSSQAGDRATVGGLLVMLTFSPCEGFLPVYLLAVRFGQAGFFTLTAILAVAALAAMLLFTWLALRGLERFRIKFFERYEAGLLGGLFIVLGALVVALEH